MENPKLKPEQYWEWRCTINEMDLAKKTLDIGYIKFEMMNKDIEISRLRAALYKTSLEDLKAKSDLTKQEYENLKKKLENELGISLNGTVIDDITFEVKKLEES